MRISVNHGFKEAQRWMTDIERKQLPFATSLALNHTKDRCQDAVKTAMLRQLHKPTPFTMNLFDNSRKTKASKRDLTAWLIVKPIQAKYLYEQFYGGTETKPHIVPGKEAKLNQYGNLPRNASKGPRTFSIRSNGVDMRLKRTGKGKNSKAKVIGIFPKSRAYRPEVDYDRVVERAFDKWFEFHWRKDFARAMATAR